MLIHAVLAVNRFYCICGSSWQETAIPELTWYLKGFIGKTVRSLAAIQPTVHPVLIPQNHFCVMSLDPATLPSIATTLIDVLFYSNRWDAAAAPLSTTRWQHTTSLLPYFQCDWNSDWTANVFTGLQPKRGRGVALEPGHQVLLLLPHRWLHLTCDGHGGPDTVRPPHSSWVSSFGLMLFLINLSYRLTQGLLLGGLINSNSSVVSRLTFCSPARRGSCGGWFESGDNLWVLVGRPSQKHTQPWHNATKHCI